MHGDLDCPSNCWLSDVFCAMHLINNFVNIHKPANEEKCKGKVVPVSQYWAMKA
jgi:hypothetical protein